MLAAYATAPNPSDPLAALEVGERPEPEVPDGWTTVSVRAASINHHDLWTLRGVGLAPDRYPMILGSDASGVDADGREVVVHGVIASPGLDRRRDPRPGRTLLSELHPGTFAERVAVPARNLLPKPAELSHVDAACLGTAWLTAYRMLFVKSGVRPGGTHPGAGRQRRGRDGADRARRGHRLPGLGHRPDRGEAPGGAGAGRARPPSSRAPGCPGGSTR